MRKLNEEKIERALGLGVNAVFVGHCYLKPEWISRFHQEKVKVFADFMVDGLWLDFIR